MRVTQAIVLSTLVIGCATGGTEFDDSPKIVSNSISFADVTANQAAITQLASGKFSLNNPAAVSMLNSAGSRQVLDYLVGCSLKAGQNFSINSGDTSYTFRGDVGLAKSWANKALTDKQKRWVSACMFARINNQGQLLRISMRGPHHALRVTQTEVSRFTQEEGVYYGDIFTGPAPVVGWSCRGKAQAAGEPEYGTALSFRDCAEPASSDSPDGAATSGGPNQCGWGYAGDCFVFDVGLPSACEKRIVTGGGIDDPDEDGDDSDSPSHGQHAANTYYKKCHAGGAIPLLQPLWKEVVTVYVENGPPSLD